MGHGAVHVLELINENADYSHGNHVLWIACHNKTTSKITNETTCQVDYFNDLLNVDNFFNEVSVVNMSFTYELTPYPILPPFLEDSDFQEDKYKKDKIEFEKNKKTFLNIIENNPKTLFTIAAGNGMRIGAFQSKGVALGASAQIYPALINTDNTLKVAAVNSSFQLADYSNFGLEFVDIAAVPENNQNGDFVMGTSFAAPVVARIADELRTLEPNLDPLTTKKILMRSCFISKIDAAIKGTIDLIKNGRNSKVYWAQYRKNRLKRIELANEIGNFMLVKSGGFLVPEVARKCLYYYQQGNALDEACLKAQKEIFNVVIDENKIKKLWKLRGI